MVSAAAAAHFTNSCIDLSWIVAPRIAVEFDGAGLAELERVHGLIWQFDQTNVQNSRSACASVFTPTPRLLLQASQQSNLRHVRPSIEMIGGQDLELDVARRGWRQLAFLIARLEQQPVRQRALAH